MQSVGDLLVDQTRGKEPLQRSLEKIDVLGLQLVWSLTRMPAWQKSSNAVQLMLRLSNQTGQVYLHNRRYERKVGAAG